MTILLYFKIIKYKFGLCFHLCVLDLPTAIQSNPTLHNPNTTKTKAFINMKGQGLCRARDPTVHRSQRPDSLLDPEPNNRMIYQQFLAHPWF